MKLALRSAVCLLFSNSLCDPASAGAFDKVPQSATPEWKTGCETRKTDQFGDAKKQYCFLALSNHHIREQLMEDNSYLSRWAVLFHIDQDGLHFTPPRKGDDLCKGAPKRIAVDGNRIDQLKPSEQIERLMHGKTLVWEEQADWPYCGIAPHGTNLHGIRVAIEKLKQEWSDVSGGWETSVGK